MLKKFQNFLIYSNIYIAIAACAQATLFFELYSIKPQLNYLGFVFSSTIVAYLFAVGYPNKSEGFKNSRIVWMNNHASLLHGIMFIAAATSAYTFFKIEQKQLIILASIITLLYHLPFKNWGFKGFRSLPYLKIFIISFVWLILCNVQILVENNVSIGGLDICRLALKFVWIIALTLPFDIRDYEQDKSNHLKTIPILIGIRGTQITSILLFIFCMSMQVLISGFTAESIAVISSSCIAIVIITRIHEFNIDFPYLVLLDGLLILQLPLYYLTKYLS